MTFALKRQFITDALGQPIGVILSLEEYALVKTMLEPVRLSASLDDKLALMAQAVDDQRFRTDLYETMADFETVDAEWWEPAV